MFTRSMFECSYCGRTFDNYEECNECEQSHIVDYKDVATNEIISELRRISDVAYMYHVCHMVAGLPLGSFENLMNEAANRLEKLMTSC